MKFLLIHGSFGNPEENWFPWLREQLEGEEHSVFIPAFPSPPQQDLASWMEIFNKDYAGLLDDDIVFIGHSIGPAFILSVLEKLERPVGGCIFVSGFLESLNNPTFDEVNKTFTEKEFDWEKIRKNCAKFVMLHGHNDPYVPLTAAERLSEKLGTGIVLVPNGGHLNAAAGYLTFPEILYQIHTLKN